MPEPGSIGSETENVVARKQGSAFKRGLLTFADFITTFLTALVIIVAVAFVVLRLLGWDMLCIETASMSPKYPVGTLVVVQPVDAEDLQVGDVVTYVFNSDGILVTHRVTGIDPSSQTITTKGDANDVEDAPVYWGNVVGKVVIGIPMAGKVLSIITAEENRKIVIGIIVALFALTVVFDVAERRGRKNSREDRQEEIPVGDKGIPGGEEGEGK